jgi:ubiquinone/menaquinone biosynthesis C-methylase UbiE
VESCQVYRLPFKDGQFGVVLCSHTLEHVEDPQGMCGELTRVGGDVTLVIPPLWDVSAALNVFEHRWVFLSLRKEHRSLPRYVELPFSAAIQRIVGQRVRA